MFRFLAVLALLSQAGCMARYTLDDQAPSVTPEEAAACRPVVMRHANDPDGGMGAQAACLRAFRATGKPSP